MSLISEEDQRLVDFIRSKINLPDWSLGMAMRAFLELEKEKIKPDMYSHDPIVHENEIILSYLNSFAREIKLWVESQQGIRISQTIDKFACIFTAYLHGLKKGKGVRS